MSAYSNIQQRLERGETILLDGGIGTELERRGAAMDAAAWCGGAGLENAALLKQIHLDYIAAGAEIITANTYASSRIMLDEAGLGNKFEEINRTAIAAAHSARKESGRHGLAVAGSLSHMVPMVRGLAQADIEKAPSRERLAEAFTELALFLRAEGCDLLILEMMYDPARAELVFEAAKETGLPVWAGFSARKSPKGGLLSFAPERDIPFEELSEILRHHDVEAAGVMHTSANIITEAIDLLRKHFQGPLMAYPDSGYFKMPHWQFEKVISLESFKRFATEWSGAGVQILGGCCGLSPEHIAALQPLKHSAADRRQ